MRGIEHIAWLYDASMALMECGRLGRWRRWLTSGASGRTLEIGCGTGRNLPLYAVPVVALDTDFALVIVARSRAPHARLLVASAEALPFRDGMLDTVVSSLVLCTVGDVPRALRELARVLAPEVLLMFSTLGPDTLKELRAAAGATRVHEFIDMHDVGDMLVAAGFAAPVMDMEMLRIDYASGERLLEDLRASGQTNARPDRPRGLAGRAFLAEFRGRKVSASYEVVYGHAWKRERAAAEPATAKSIRIFKRIP
jgi:malonyl-CoA O-methyltransferase